MKRNPWRAIWIGICLTGAIFLLGLFVFTVCFTAQISSSSVGIIGGADGPTAIFVASQAGGGILLPLALLLLIGGAVGLILHCVLRRRK